MHADPRLRKVLDERARRLATPMHDATALGVPWLEFALGRERLAVDATLVCGTFRFTDSVPLPGCGLDVVGMSLWRGAFLRVLDLRRLIGGETIGLDDRAMVVALGHAGPKFGMLVGELLGVRRVSPDGVLPLDSEARFLTGVTADAIQLLDGAALLRIYG